MSTKDFYDDWLDEYYGIQPEKGADSFNNIIFSTQLILGKMALEDLKRLDLDRYLYHLQKLDDGNGLYAPKNSHDNITAKIAGVVALGLEDKIKMNLSEAVKSKHPRDRILYGLWLAPKFYHWLLIWFPMFEIVRATVSKGKVRPVWWESWSIFFSRVLILLRLMKHVDTKPAWAGEHLFYGRS